MNAVAGWLIPIVVFGMIWFAISDKVHTYAPAASRRTAFVLAFIGFEAVLAVITEVTSVGHHLTRNAVTLAWLAVLVVLVSLTHRRLLEVGRAGLHRLRSPARAPSGLDEWAAALVLTAIAGILVVQGWVYRQSNADALSYHLARVEHWIQNQSVAHFATHFSPQIEYTPLAEYNILHLHLLTGTDRFDGYVQLFAAFVCVVAVTDIARLLRGSDGVQLATAVVCATVPSGLLEATTAQNDYVAAAFTTTTLLVLLVWWRGARPFACWLALATTLSLALLTKATSVPQVAPVAIGLAVVILARAARRESARAALQQTWPGFVVGILIAVALVGPFVARNVDLFGKPTGPWADDTSIHGPTPAVGAANVFRNVAANFDIGDGSGVESKVGNVVRDVMQKGFDRTGVAIDDRRYAIGIQIDPFPDGDYSQASRNEDIGANPWHVTLIAVTLGGLVALVALRRRDNWLALLLAVGLSAGFVIFVSVTPFQRFGVRLGLPLLVAWAPLVAVFIGQAPRLVGRLVLGFLVVASLPALLDSWTRSMLHPAYPFESRLAPYFPFGYSNADSVSAADVEDLTDAVAQSACDHVALANYIPLEYPIWVGLDGAGWHGRIEATEVGVSGYRESREYMTPGFDDCVALRREVPSWVTPADGRVHLRWDVLDAAFVPAAAARLRTTAAGIASATPGVRVLPGSGWGLPNVDGRASMAADATLYVCSDVPGRRTLQIEGAPRSVTATARAVDGRATAVPLSIQPDGGLSFAAESGIVEVSVHLDGVDATSGASTPVRVTAT